MIDRARESATGHSASNGSGNFTPSGEFSFQQPFPSTSTSSSSSFSNGFGNGNSNGKKNGKFAAPTSSSSSSSSDVELESASEGSDSDIIIEKPDSELSEAEKVQRAAEKKDQGNVAYKKGDYPTATRHYSNAISLNPIESSYFLNRAAAKMGSKLFSSALEDCLAAQALQSRDKSSGGGIQSKTYLRTAKCQLALGLIGPAQQSLQEAFRLEPSNRAIVTEKGKADRIAGHVSKLKENLEKKDWSMVLLGVDAAVRELGEGSSPREWRGWKVEALVGKKRYDEAAGLAA